MTESLYLTIQPRLDTQPKGDEETEILTLPRSGDGDTDSERSRVILYNDDYHNQDDVVQQVIKATGCTTHKALRIMLEAHHKGRAICFRGSRDKCQKVVTILREIRLQCEIDSDD